MESSPSFRSFNVNITDDNYISLTLNNLIEDDDSRDSDTWNVVLREYNESRNSSLIGNRQFEEFPKDYFDKGSGFTHLFEVVPGEDITLINFYYNTKKDSYTIQGTGGDISNKQEIDFIISWYVRIDNIEVKDK